MALKPVILQNMADPPDPVSDFDRFPPQILPRQCFRLAEHNGLPFPQGTYNVTITEYHEFSKIVGYEVVPDYTYITAAVTATDILTTSVALNTTCDIENFFTGWTVEFTSATDPDLVGITRTVEYYRAFDKRIFFDEPILEATITAADTVALKTDLYQVRVDVPFSIGALPTIDNLCEDDNNIVYRVRSGSVSTPLTQGTLAGVNTTTTVELPVSVGTANYTGTTLWITSDPILIDNSLVATSSVNAGGVQVQGTFTLPAAASIFPDDFLNNMTLNITSSVDFIDRSYIITSWDNATLTGTVDPSWTSVIGTSPAGGDDFTITQPNPSQYRLITSYDTTTRIATVDKPFSYTNVSGTTTSYVPTVGTTFEILQFSHDNYHELDYPHSMVSQQQAHCYEISLITLTLPNVELLTGIGGKISEYPYVYVEFRSVTQGTSAYDFNSNNPIVSKNIMFRAPVIYNYRPEIAKFVVLDGHGMCQILKFKPNDAFKFSVYLPNGELFTTAGDYLPPSEPNPLLQVTACFGVKRIQ